MNRHLVAVLAAVLVSSTPLAAGNLLVNGGFDRDLSGWTPRPGGIPSWKVEWTPFDAGYDVASGSARLEFSDSYYGAVAGLGQCVPVTAGGHYLLAGQLYIDQGTPPTRIALQVFWSTQADCSTETTGFEMSTEVQDTLVFRHEGVIAPAGAVAGKVWLFISRKSAAVPVAGRFDNIYFGEWGIEPCTPSPTTLCLDDQAGDRRFEVQVDYSTVQGGGYVGVAVPVPLNAQGVRRGGVLWFFEPDNPEMLIKVLEGCDTNDHYWVFYSAGTNVGFTVHVRDTLNDRLWTQTNPDLHAAPPVQDTSAFPCDG